MTNDFRNIMEILLLARTRCWMNTLWKLGYASIRSLLWKWISPFWVALQDGARLNSKKCGREHVSGALKPPKDIQFRGPLMLIKSRTPAAERPRQNSLYIFLLPCFLTLMHWSAQPLKKVSPKHQPPLSPIWASMVEIWKAAIRIKSKKCRKFTE